jgi:hypothetical protein
VRDLIERLANDNIDVGFHIEATNSREAHFVDRGGGRVEREIAAEYRKIADALRGRWERTKAIFDSLADDWERWAARRDDEAALRRTQEKSLGDDQP